MESSIVLTKKKDDNAKCRTCANGSAQCFHIFAHEASSHVVTTESTLLTTAMEVKEERNDMMLGTHNDFSQARVPKDDSE